MVESISLSSVQQIPPKHLCLMLQQRGVIHIKFVLIIDLSLARLSSLLNQELTELSLILVHEDVEIFGGFLKFFFIELSGLSFQDI